jgi:predicted HTH transcriptional regulator
LQGTLPEMIDAAEQFIRRNTRLAAKIVNFRRREVTEYLFVAIREAICNAVCHRDYRIEGAAIRISIFDDRIEVNSPGGLPAGVTLANIEPETRAAQPDHRQLPLRRFLHREVGDRHCPDAAGDARTRTGGTAPGKFA